MILTPTHRHSDTPIQEVLMIPTPYPRVPVSPRLRVERSGGLTDMSLIVKNFLGILVVVFLFVALGQWNHPNFKQKAYDQARELIISDMAEKGEKPGNLIEPPDFSADFFHAEVVTEDGTRYSYDIGIKNPIWIQLSALNLIVSPKVEITGFIKSQP